jgi:DNA invertase Pin-like site-specific DNA recombinase
MSPTAGLLSAVAQWSHAIGELRAAQRAAVQRLSAGGMSERAIAAGTGLSRTTVRRWTVAGGTVAP